MGTRTPASVSAVAAPAAWALTARKGSVLATKAEVTQGRCSVFAAKAVKTQGKGSVLAAKAVETEAVPGPARVEAEAEAVPLSHL